MTTESSELNGFIDIDSEMSPPVERDHLYRLWEENKLPCSHGVFVPLAM
ncbi:MAG TPA: hypothetical protein VF043_39630 [Ktedonobacteraceae bacterium]